MRLRLALVALVLAVAGCDGGSPLATEPREVLVLPDIRGRVLHLRDTEADSVVRRVPIPVAYPGEEVFDVVTAPDSGRVLVSVLEAPSAPLYETRGRVLSVDLSSGAVSQIADFPADLVGADGAVVAVRVSGGDRSVYALTPEGLEPRGSAAIGQPTLGPTVLSLDPSQPLLYARDEGREVLVYDYAAGEETSVPGLSGLFVSNEFAVVPREGGSPVLHAANGPIVDARSGEQVGTLETPFASLGWSRLLDLVAVTECSRKYCVGGDGAVTLHDPASGARVGEVDVQAATERPPLLSVLALARGGRTAYVKGLGGGLYALDLPSRSLAAEHRPTFGFDHMTVAALRP